MPQDLFKKWLSLEVCVHSHDIVLQNSTGQCISRKGFD